MNLRFSLPIAILLVSISACSSSSSSSGGGSGMTSGGGSGMTSGGGAGMTSGGGAGMTSGGGSEMTSGGGAGMTSGGGFSMTSGPGSSSSGMVDPGKCRSGKDCQPGDFCNVINLPPFCGGQCDNSNANDCQADADCAAMGADLICDKPCKCWHGGAVPAPHCTQGCATDPDCGPSMVCNALKRCEPKSCSVPADCTGNFLCTADASGKHCASKSCAVDAECQDYCVNGECSPTLGSCEPAVP